MAPKSGIEKFTTAFVQVHLLSILFSTIVYKTSGILYSLLAYLVSIHLAASIVYILDIRDGRILKSALTSLKTI